MVALSPSVGELKSSAVFPGFHLVVVSRSHGGSQTARRITNCTNSTTHTVNHVKPNTKMRGLGFYSNLVKVCAFFACLRAHLLEPRHSFGQMNNKTIINYSENLALLNGIKSNNVKFYMLGDSVLRDTTIALHNMFSEGKNQPLSRSDGKKSCMKSPNDRDSVCFIDFVGTNMTSEFIWFQWFSLPHRQLNISGMTHKLQE